MFKVNHDHDSFPFKEWDKAEMSKISMYVTDVSSDPSKSSNKNGTI